jgi:hypothetical protein
VTTQRLKEIQERREKALRDSCGLLSTPKEVQLLTDIHLLLLAHDQLQEERDRLRQAAESALASLGTGPAKDGYAFGVLHAALSSLSEQEGTG